MVNDPIPEPLNTTIPLNAGRQHSSDPYKGFKRRELDENGEVRETPIIVQPPTFGQRLSNLFWSTITAMAVMFVATHYKTIEAIAVALIIELLKLIGL